MYPVKLGIKDTTESNTSAVYLGLLLFIVRDDKLHTSLYNKRDKFQVFPFYTIFARQGCFYFTSYRIDQYALIMIVLSQSLREFKQGYVMDPWNRQ